MSRFFVPARIGTFALTGAVCLAVATASVANAQTARITPKSAGCPAQSKIVKAAGVKLNKPTVEKKTSGKTTIVQCVYLNPSDGVLVLVQPKLYAPVPTSEFNAEIRAADKQYGTGPIHNITKAGKAAAYFQEKRKVLGRRDFYGAIDASKHLIGLGDNQSAAREIKIARAIG